MGQIKDYLESKKKQTVSKNLEELHAAARQSVGNVPSGNTALDRSGKTREQFDHDVRQNYAARQSASAAQKSTATANQAAGKYYSQPAADPALNRLGNSLEVYQKNAEQKEAALNTANANAQRLYNTLKELESQGARLGQYSTSKLAMAKLNEVKEQYQQTYDQYQQAAQQAQSAYEEYTPAWEQYAAAAKDFGTSYAAQQKAYTDWKGSIRADESAITAELEAAQATLETLKEQREAVGQRGSSAGAILEEPNTSGFDIDPARRMRQQAEKRSEREQREKLTEEIGKVEAEVERLQEELNWRKYFNYADLTKNADFAEKSQYKSTANGKRKVDAWGSFLTGDGGGLVFENSGYDDPLYDWINGDKEAGAALKLEAGERYGAEGGSAGRLWAYSTEGEQQAAEMDEEERKIFNYLYATKGKEEAYQYYNQLRKDLSRRQRNTEQEKWAEYAKEHPVGASALSVMASPLKGLSYGAQAADYLVKGEIDQNAAYNKASYIPSTIRGQVSQMAEEKWGAPGSFLYQTGMSMADFLYNSLVTGSFLGERVLGEAGAKAANNLSLAIMGTGAAADATIEAKDRGLTDKQAFTLGTVAGLAEVITEKVSVEALFNSSWEEGALRYILKNAISEGGEEVASDLINLFADVLVSQDKSQWQTALEEYKTDGKTETEAFWLAAKDQALEMGVDFLGGALSGGVMAGAGVAIGKAGAAISQRGEQRKTAPNVGAVVADTTKFEHSILQNLNKARSAFLEFAGQHFPKSVTNVKTGKEIGISRTGLDKFLSGRIPYEKYASGYHIPELIERAHKVAEAVNTHQEQANSIPTYEYYDSPIKIDGADYMAHIRVRNTKMGDKYYGHTISEVDDIKIEPSARASVPGEAPAVQSVNAIDGSGESVLQREGKVNPLDESERYKKTEDSTDTGYNASETADPAHNARSVPPSEPSLVDSVPQSGEEVKPAVRQGRVAEVTAEGNIVMPRGGETGDFYLPTAQQEEILRRAAKAQTETERTGILAGASEKAIAQAQRLGEVIGREVVFYSEASDSLGNLRNGYYAPTDGRIYVNTQSDNPLAQIVAHELTHSLEESGSYRDLERLVLKRLQKQDALDGLRQSYQALYARSGVELDARGVDQEIVATYVEKHLLTDEAEIRSIVTGNRTLGQRILTFLNQLLGKLGNADAAERAFLLKARSAYEAALEESRTGAEELNRKNANRRGLEELREQLSRGEITEEEAEDRFNDLYDPEEDLERRERGVKNSVSTEENGQAVAVVDSDILSHIDTSAWDKAKAMQAKAAAKEALLKFADGVQVNDVAYKVNRTSRREFTRSKDTERLAKKKPNVFADKMRTAQVADDVITATTGWARDGGLTHLRADNFIDFTHGNVLIQAGDNQYKAETVVGITAGGEYVFYDVVGMEPTAFSIKKEPSTTAANKNVSSDIQEGSDTAQELSRGVTVSGSLADTTSAASRDSIFSEAENVKRYSISHDSQGRKLSEGQREFFKDSKVVDEEGRLLVVYHGTDDRFTVFDTAESRVNEGSFFFAQNREDAAAYSSIGRVLPFYVNLRNPIDYNAMPSEIYKLKTKKEQVAALKRMGYDGWMADMETGWGEVSAFYPEQVKSVTNLNPTENADIRYSISPTFGEEIQDWFDGGSDGQRVFTLGSTGEVLQGLGAIESDIYMNGDKISTILSSHPEMTLREIQRIPEVLEDPVLVLASKNGNKRNSRLVLFGSLKAQDGRPVMCVLDLRPTENGLLLDDMQKVTSAYTKDTNPVGFIRDSEILFADKKRTASLLKSVGFWAPTELQQNGYIGSITYQKRSVKLDGVPFDRVVSTETGVFEPEYSNPAWREAVEAGREQRRKNRRKRYWKPKLNQAEWQLLNRTMERGLANEQNTLDEETKWVYASEKGTKIFALYGVGDGTEATALYATGGKRAESDYRAVAEHEKEYDNSAYRNRKGLNRLLEATRNRERNGDGGLYVDRHGGKTAGYDGISAQQGESDGRGSVGHGSEDSGGRNSLSGAMELLERMERIAEEAKAEGWSYEKQRAKQQEAVEGVYQDLIEKYGAMKPGEKAAREIEVPKKSGKGEKVYQTVRTILEGQATPDEMVPRIQELVDKGELSYEALSDKKAIERAEDTIQDKGWAETYADWMKDSREGKISKEHTALGWALYNNAANSGNTEVAIGILMAVVGNQHDAAQAVQATRIFKQLTPEGQFYGIMQSVERMQQELNQKYGDRKAPKLRVNEELGEEFLNAETEEQRDEARKNIYRDVGRQLPSRFRDRWNAWRYLAMLGNTRTHVRNLFGNAFFAPVVAVKDTVATGMEAAVGKLGKGRLERTKGLAGLNGELAKAAWADYAKAAPAIMDGGKYGDMENSNKYVEEGRKVFGNTRFEAWNQTGGKVLETIRKGNGNALDVEDAWFAKPHYVAALSQYCAANHITAEQLREGKLPAVEKARNYAIREAQKATYRDCNELSAFFSSLGSGLSSSSSKVNRAMGVAVEGILPFRKTPANILARGLEYSPAGLLKGLTYDLVQVAKGNMTGAEAIDHISAGLTGTGLFALGMAAAAGQLVRGHGSGDEDENEFEELMGHQSYALELPNGTSVTLDWLAPECLPFFVGVNLQEQLQAENGELSLSMLLNAATTVTEPLLEMSCLQSLNAIFDAVGYAKSDGLDGLPAALASSATSYLTQAVPTLAGQLERIGEDKRYTTYTGKNSVLTSDMQYTLGKLSAKIPGVDYSQIPYLDAWGRMEETGSLGTRAFNNLVNPAYVSQIDTSEMEEELLRLYKATGEASVFPSRAAKYIKVGGERMDLSAEEYVQYATLKGQKSYELLGELVNSKLYLAMDDEKKAEAVADTYSLANQLAKEAVSDYKPKSSRYNDFISAGLDDGTAYRLTTTLNALEPEDGKENVSNLQKYRAILDDGLSDTKTMTALSAVMPESEYAKLEVGNGFGVTAAAYVIFKEQLPQYDEDGNGSYSQEEVEKAIDSLGYRNGIMLPGGKKTAESIELTREEKAALWQMANKAWKGSSNPYSKKVGRKVYEALNAE